jgi:hypothetical protein
MMPGNPRIDLGEGFVRQHELIEQLREDIDTAYRLLEKDRSSQYLRRCVVRAIFSFIEALIECVKWELRSSVRAGEFLGLLSAAEQEVLGSLHVIGARNDKFLSLDQNIKKTFRLATKIWQLTDFYLDTSGTDFQDFLRAKLARNRLTHPKTVYDIEVNDYDMSCHTIAGMWVQVEMLRLFEARIDSLAAGYSSTQDMGGLQSDM